MDARIQQQSLEQEILDLFPTIYDYYETVLFGTSSYYGSGKVQFNVDFWTFASDPNEVIGLSAAFVCQLFIVRKNLLATGALNEDDLFHVLECGGGKGDLCFHIIQTITKLAQHIPGPWESFRKSLRYHLVEISPALAEKQRKRTIDYKDQVNVINGDSRKLSEYFKDIKIAAAISNELLDAMPVHVLKTDENKKPKIKQIVPSITEDNFKKHFESVIENITLDAIKEESGRHLAILKLNNPAFETTNEILLSKALFKKLFSSKTQLPQSVFSFKEITIVDAKLCPEVKQFLERHPQFISSFKANEEMLIEVDIKNYLAHVNKILLPGGEIITIDYAMSHYGVDHRLRTYFNKTEANYDIFTTPGSLDITHDVNASIVDQEGNFLGLKTKFFVKQEQLPIPNLLDHVISEKDKSIFYQRSARRYFTVIVQHKDYAQNLSFEIPRFTGEKLPISYDYFSEAAKIFENYDKEFEKEITFTKKQTSFQLSQDDLVKCEESIKYAAGLSYSFRHHYLVHHKSSASAIINIQEKEYTLAEILKSYLACRAIALTLTKIKNHQLITATEKKWLLDNGSSIYSYANNYPALAYSCSNKDILVNQLNRQEEPSDQVADEALNNVLRLAKT